MDIFNNRQVPGYEEITGYGPKWWTEYKEMDAVYRYAGWTLDLMALWLEKLVLNQFPTYADEDAIALLERILRIEPLPGESIEERRRVVAATLGGSGKFGATDIKALIKGYSGCDSDIWWEDFILHIRMLLNDETSFTPSKISTLIERKIPAHIAVYYNYLIACFEAAEKISHRIILRMPFSGFDGFIDGSFYLDGEKSLDASAISETAEFAMVKSTGREVL